MRILLTSGGRLGLRVGKIALAIPGAAGGGGGGGGGGGSATGISIVDLPELTVLQRVAGKKPVPIGCNVVGDAGIAVEARIVTEAGDGVTPWASIGVTDASGNAAGSIVTPEGGWYKAQVRVANSQLLVATTTTKFGVGAVVLMLGQSNMYNMTVSGQFGYPTGHPQVVEPTSGTGVGPGAPPYIYRRIGRVKDTDPPNTMGSGGTTVGKTAPGHVHLGNLLAMGLRVPVLLLNKAKSGSKIDTVWLAGQSGWLDLENAVAGIGGDFELAYWYQGESNSGMSKATMMGHLATLHGQLKALNGRNNDTFKFGIVSLGPVSLGSTYSGASDTKFGVTRSAHVEYANNTPGAFFAAAAHVARASDGVHVTGTYQARTGARMAMSRLALDGIGQSGAGPRVTSANRNGNEVTLYVQLPPGATAIKDGDGGAGSALLGFEFRDALGELVSYSASSIAGTSIKFTCNAPPATVSYAMANAPHSSDSTLADLEPLHGSCVYDDVTIVNCPVGSPLQPFAAMNIN